MPWTNLNNLSGINLLNDYKAILLALSTGKRVEADPEEPGKTIEVQVHEDPLISAIYADAQTRLREPRHLEQKDSLYMLKHEFGISMMGILFRAGQIGIISQPLQKNYYIQFNKLRWRTEEPSDAYPNEQTFLYKQLVYRALGESYIGGSKAAEFLKMPLSRFHKERKLGVVNASTD